MRDMENLRKKEWKRNTKQNGRPVKQTRTMRRQNLKTWREREIKVKTKELLVTQLKICERNMQELNESIKGPNLRIMGIEEGE
jgi:hypothetical protein